MVDCSFLYTVKDISLSLPKNIWYLKRILEF